MTANTNETGASTARWRVPMRSPAPITSPMLNGRRGYQPAGALGPVGDGYDG